MQKNVRQMMADRIQAPQSIIYGVGKPCKGMPVSYIKIKESPLYEGAIQRPNMRIRKNIVGIVPLDEFVAE